MTQNTRRQNKYSPYKLVIDSKEYGCYQFQGTAISMARSLLAKDKAHSYQVYYYDRLVDEDHKTDYTKPCDVVDLEIKRFARDQAAKDMQSLLDAEPTGGDAA